MKIDAEVKSGFSSSDEYTQNESEFGQSLDSFPKYKQVKQNIILQTHLRKDTRRKTKEKEKLLMSKDKEGAKNRTKKTSSSSSESKAVFTNHSIVEFINLPEEKVRVFDSEQSLQRGLVDKLNGIARVSSDFIDEEYELRFQRDKNPKYI